MLFPSHIITIVADCVTWADKLTRADLARGYIASENDYTSNFTGAFRREINSRLEPGLTAESFVLNPRIERKLGADACFVFVSDQYFKIGIFEAKWPRLSTRTNCWDSIQKSTSSSHFHDQLERQDQAPNKYAKWEMFYCEYPFKMQPGYMPDTGSACVWHEHAFAKSNARSDPKAVWVDSDLESLLGTSMIDVGRVAFEICSCQKGEAYEGNNFLMLLEETSAPKNVLVIRHTQDQGSLN